MFLSEGIINNFIEGLDDADIVKIETLEDEAAYSYILELYKRNYGAFPSGAAIYLLRTKFNFGDDESNRRYIPSHLF